MSLFLLGVSVLHFIRRFSVSKIIEPGGERGNADIAIMKVDGEIDIRYITLRKKKHS